MGKQRETKFRQIKDSDLTYWICPFLQNPYAEEKDATDFVTVFEPQPSVLDLFSWSLLLICSSNWGWLAKLMESFMKDSKIKKMQNFISFLFSFPMVLLKDTVLFIKKFYDIVHGRYTPCITHTLRNTCNKTTFIVPLANFNIIIAWYTARTENIVPKYKR